VPTIPNYLHLVVRSIHCFPCGVLSTLDKPLTCYHKVMGAYAYESGGPMKMTNTIGVMG